jgi:hypothetical protein
MPDKFEDIQLKKKESIEVDSDFVMQSSKFKSPHVIDLKGRPRLRHEQPTGLQDVKNTLAKDLKKQKRLFQEKHDPEIQIASRFTEMTRMMAIGLTVVFSLNSIGVYYEGLKLKEDIAAAAYTSYESILEEGPSHDAFMQAEDRFEEAQESLWFLQNQRTELLSQSKTATAVSNLLTAGEQLSEAGSAFMAFVDNARVASESLLTESVAGVSVTDQIRTTYENDFMLAYTNLASANQLVQDVDVGIFPEDLKETVANAQVQLQDLSVVFEKFDELFPLIMSLLGDRYPQRYLVLLENNNESRPGGGFIGSYMIIDINDGQLDGMSFNDVYEIDGQYHEAIAPPAEIARLTNNWRLRDSNYSPDLAVSAQKAAWFLEEEGGPGVDHVITIDLTFVSELLAITGPIKLDQLPVALDAYNFSTIISYMVESKLSGEQNPKEVLGELIEKVQEKLKEQKPLMEVVQLIQGMAQSKHFSAYSKHEKIQTFFDDFGVSGVVPNPVEGEDYFMFVHTAVGGNKTDAYTTQHLEHQTLIQEDGAVLNQVTITRNHGFDEFEEMKLKNLLASFGFSDPEQWVLSILGSGTNTTAMRVYVPHGSRLISSVGIDESDIAVQYDEDLMLDYFYFTDSVYPGTSEAVSLTYELPFTLDFEPLDEYRINVVKQPGDTGTIFTKTIVGDNGLIHYKSYPEELTENAHEERIGVYTYEVEFEQDLHLAQLWGR